MFVLVQPRKNKPGHVECLSLRPKEEAHEELRRHSRGFCLNSSMLIPLEDFVDLCRHKYHLSFVTGEIFIVAESV